MNIKQMRQIATIVGNRLDELCLSEKEFENLVRFSLDRKIIYIDCGKVVTCPRFYVFLDEYVFQKKFAVRKSEQQRYGDAYITAILSEHIKCCLKGYSNYIPSSKWLRNMCFEIHSKHPSVLKITPDGTVIIREAFIENHLSKMKELGML